MMDVVIDQRGEQVVRSGDRGKIAGEMQVDVFHRHHLGVTAACRTALHAEHGPQCRLADADDAFFADAAQSIAQAYQFVQTGNAELGFVALNPKEQALIEQLRWTSLEGREDVYALAQRVRSIKPWVLES